MKGFCNIVFIVPFWNKVLDSYLLVMAFSCQVYFYDYYKSINNNSFFL